MKEEAIKQIALIKIKNLCPYNGWRGEFRQGTIDLTYWKRETHNPIQMHVSQSSEYGDDDEDDEDGESRCDSIAEIRMSKAEAEALWNHLGTALRMASKDHQK